MTRRRLPSIVADVGSAALALALAAALAYVLGSRILIGDLQGNDSPLHIAYAAWLNRYFPSIPNWYPVQGAGISLVHGYPILSHLLVVGVHRASDLTILQSFRLLSFLSMVGAGFGVYLFGRVVLRRRVIGFLAELFFLLSPICWTWLYNWGFFPQQVAFVGVPFALVAFEKAWDANAFPAENGSRRLWLVALTVSLVLTTLCHLLVGFAAAAGMVLYVFLASLIIPKGKRRRSLGSGLKVLLFSGVLVGLVTAAYVVPFYHYGSFANREGLNTPSEDSLHRLPLDTFFGLAPIDNLEILTRMQFPLAVIVAALIGLLASLWVGPQRDHDTSKPLALSLTTLFAVVFALTPALPGLVLKLSSTLFFFMNFRSMLVLAMVLVPAMAAYGLSRLGDLITYPLRLAVGGSGERSRPPIEAAGSALSMSTAFVVAFGFLAVLGKPATGLAGRYPYGPETNGINLTDIWGTLGDSENPSILAQLAPSAWPDFSLRPDDPLTSKSEELAALVEGDQPTRIDISPYLGRLAMDLATFADASQINTYTYTASLFHRMWGYQQNVYFSHESEAEEYGNVSSLNNAAAWFGTNYVFVSATQDPVELYDAAGWSTPYADDQTQLRENPDPQPLAEFTDRPVFLVVSKPETDGYMNLFRLANDGLLAFDQALLVEGDPQIDRYSVDELRQFDGLILYGYDYQDSAKAWELLKEYVEGGGRLFVDTGWEFWIPEWEFDQAPELLPVDRLTWTNYGNDPTYEILAPEIAGNIDPEALKPLEWEGLPWTVSGGSPEDVRPWGRVVLAAGGNPLVVAGEYGQGRVIWSGMNLLAHAQYQGLNAEELKLIHDLFAWLTPIRPSEPSVDLALARDDPDHVWFSMNAEQPVSGWLYWREAEYPRWNADIASTGAAGQAVPIYRAGPGFMLMPVDLGSGTTTLGLRWVPSIDERISEFVTVVGLVLLSACALDGLLLEGKGLTWLKIAVITRVPRPFLGDQVSSEWVERKRQQIRDGAFSHGQKRYDASEAVPWMRSEQASTQPNYESGASNGNVSGAVPNHGRVESPVADGEGTRTSAERLRSVDEEQVLQSWLEDAGHEDDEWASKLLGNRNKPNKG